jgi:hypothetical protein
MQKTANSDIGFEPPKAHGENATPANRTPSMDPDTNRAARSRRFSDLLCVMCTKREDPPLLRDVGRLAERGATLILRTTGYASG